MNCNTVCPNRTQINSQQLHVYTCYINLNTFKECLWYSLLHKAHNIILSASFSIMICEPVLTYLYYMLMHP